MKPTPKVSDAFLERSAAFARLAVCKEAGKIAASQGRAGAMDYLDHNRLFRMLPQEKSAVAGEIDRVLAWLGDAKDLRRAASAHVLGDHIARAANQMPKEMAV